ncbi:Hypothetical_protein [Hexamita inflata]|uniref:Hypothetical_protein n=1 Tax=Hexamita inflata TaxID=28002 RepID=A0AA86QGA1_9EUKA|nr:Hypothetical protein HINF_LOCUS43811 [Hexamita inflata]
MKSIQILFENEPIVISFNKLQTGLKIAKILSNSDTNCSDDITGQQNYIKNISQYCVQAPIFIDADICQNDHRMKLSHTCAIRTLTLFKKTVSQFENSGKKITSQTIYSTNNQQVSQIQQSRSYNSHSIENQNIMLKYQQQLLKKQQLQQQQKLEKLTKGENQQQDSQNRKITCSDVKIDNNVQPDIVNSNLTQLQDNLAQNISINDKQPENDTQRSSNLQLVESTQANSILLPVTNQQSQLDQQNIPKQSISQIPNVQNLLFDLKLPQFKNISFPPVPNILIQSSNYVKQSNIKPKYHLTEVQTLLKRILTHVLAKEPDQLQKAYQILKIPETTPISVVIKEMTNYLLNCRTEVIISHFQEYNSIPFEIKQKIQQSICDSKSNRQKLEAFKSENYSDSRTEIKIKQQIQQQMQEEDVQSSTQEEFELSQKCNEAVNNIQNQNTKDTQQIEVKPEIQDNQIIQEEQPIKQELYTLNRFNYNLSPANKIVSQELSTTPKKTLVLAKSAWYAQIHQNITRIQNNEQIISPLQPQYFICVNNSVQSSQLIINHRAWSGKQNFELLFSVHHQICADVAKQKWSALDVSALEKGLSLTQLVDQKMALSEKIEKAQPTIEQYENVIEISDQHPEHLARAIMMIFGLGSTCSFNLTSTLLYFQHYLIFIAPDHDFYLPIIKQLLPNLLPLMQNSIYPFKKQYKVLNTDELQTFEQFYKNYCQRVKNGKLPHTLSYEQVIQILGNCENGKKTAEIIGTGKSEPEIKRKPRKE